MSNHAIRLRVRDQIAFLNLAARALKDEFLGFQPGVLHAELRELGLLYYVVASSENLSDALTRASRYSVIMNEGVVQGVCPRQDMTRWQSGISASAAIPTGIRLNFGWWCFCTGLRRILSGQRIIPRSVRFVHMRKHANAGFSAIFGDDIKFGASVDEVVFFCKILRKSRSSEQIPTFNKLLVKYSDEALTGGPRKARTFQSSVQNVPLFPCCRTARRWWAK